MDPFQFESFCGELLRSLGYDEVIVTQKSNDKGVDIFAKYDGETIVAQCKRYKGQVSSPDMQKFIGAMQNARCSKGVFITTGEFTKDAETMAIANNVELIDKIKLAKLIS